MPAVIDRRYRTGSNEVDTGKYSGSWLLKKVDRLWLRVESRHLADQLSTIKSQLLRPLSRLHRSSVAAAVSAALQNAGGTPATTTIGPGKLYPVTAAQLLPNLTGFLTPLHNRN
jgi:hypothetical protein